MAWTCVRCGKRIFEPRKKAIRYAFRWKFIKSRGELLLDLKNLKDIRKNAVVTHFHCNKPEVEGFKDRMKAELRMPVNVEHPMLF